MKQQTLETIEPDLFSSIRRHINALKQKQVLTRKQAINGLLAIIKNDEQLSSVVLKLPLFYDEVMMMANKDILKCLSDNSQYNREHALQIIIQLIQRCNNITPFLPYIFAVLIDRTNCNDLEGIANLPQKMRPAPGQKPKVISKLVQPCQQIRLQYCILLKKIFVLVKQTQIRDKLDEVVNILRALIMDPSPQIQKNACETLIIFCEYFKAILLHYTEIMGRAVLLPLVSKKSKIRIAGLKALTAVLRCGIWKYNAFVFQNLIGFRDPNSVPIKDFYEASNNINYLATFVNDPNVKVREEFLSHLKIWTCELQDKYDHHGRVVPYILSGFFDSDDNVKNIAISIIIQIGKQIEQEKQKEFRENKQYAIDAAWTWSGKLVDLPVQQPIRNRPSLGSRVFVRGHVRKFWPALYKQIKDINYQNRIRACYLVLYGTIYTQNYMTQYLDVMIPHILSSIIPKSSQDKPIANLLQKTMFYLGRYCEVSAYLHIMTSAIKGQLVQNEEFLKAALKGLAKLIQGNFEAIPEETGLCHKRIQIDQLISMIDQCSMCSEIYRQNSLQSLSVVIAILNGLKAKATSQQALQIMQKYSLSIMKLLAVSYYQHYYDFLTTKQAIALNRQEYAYLNQKFQLINSLYPDYFSVLDNYMRQAYMNPPSLMDADWKLIIVLHNLLSQTHTESQALIFQLAQQVICESLSLNRSVQILNFIFKYTIYLFEQVPQKQKLSKLHLLITKSLQNLLIFKPIKKVPIYDQHLQKPQTDPNVITIPEDVFVPLFINCSEAIQGFYTHKIQILPIDLGKIIHNYIKIFNKFSRHKTILLQGIKTLWVVFQRAELNEQSPALMTYENAKDRIVVFQQVIDWLVERLQTLGQPDHQKLAMLFHIFAQVLKCCPKIPNVVTKLPYFYANYPILLQKLFKYAMDEKDLQTKDKYKSLLIQMCDKMRPWFELQARLSQNDNRFARTALLKSILDKSN